MLSWRKHVEYFTQQQCGHLWVCADDLTLHSIIKHAYCVGSGDQSNVQFRGTAPAGMFNWLSLIEVQMFSYSVRPLKGTAGV